MRVGKVSLSREAARLLEGPVVHLRRDVSALSLGDLDPRGLVGEVAITSVSPVRTSWYWLVPFASLVTRSFVTSTSDRALIVSGVDVTERNRPN